MKVVEKRAPLWYVGLRDRCDNCKALVEFEHGDLSRNTEGDYKDQSLWLWTCPECGVVNSDTQNDYTARR